VHLNTFGSMIYNLVLGLSNQGHLVICLEVAIEQPQAIQDQHQARQDLATRVWDLVLERSDEAPSLAAVLSSIVDLVEGRVDVASTNRVH
jgi:hypothetical protein